MADEQQDKPSYDIEIDLSQGEPQTSTPAEPEDINLSDALQRLVEAEALIRKHQDDVLRVTAEMQNLRRRTEQDIEKAHKYGQERFASELLSVVDNLERAAAAASGSEDPQVQAILDGVNLTLKSFQDCFRKFSIEAIDPLGQPFDPACHQAMSLVDNPEVEPNTVTAVLQKGYSLHGRVIRPAMVMVAKG
ncbi:MAG: hypothetical protein RLZZ385_1832 [Pseudomonadota bacterium]|jgi:molecular chaperone GrpE